MKSHIRSAGFSTGPIELDADSAQLVMAVMRAPGYLEAVAVDEVAIDGEDSADVMVSMLSRAPQRDQVHAAFTNATTMAGFNVIDVDLFHERTGVPIISVVRDEPDMGAVEDALRTRFGDPGTRLEILSRREWTEIGGIHATWTGVDEAGARELLSVCTLRGNIPEPLRVARLIASAIGTGMSHGRV